MVEPITWILSQIWWFILKLLSKFGIEWAKKKFRSKIEREIEIENKGDISFVTEQPFPAARLKFEVRSKSDIDLSTKSIVAGVYWGSMLIDKISWQEGTLEKTFPCHSVPNLPAKKNDHFIFYYPLPLNVDFGKHGLSLRGIIEFDFGFGTVDTNFIVNFDLSENKWSEALDKWKESGKSDRTIISGSGKALVY